MRPHSSAGRTLKESHKETLSFAVRRCGNAGATRLPWGLSKTAIHLLCDQHLQPPHWNCVFLSLWSFPVRLVRRRSRPRNRIPAFRTKNLSASALSMLFWYALPVLSNTRIRTRPCGPQLAGSRSTVQADGNSGAAEEARVKAGRGIKGSGSAFPNATPMVGQQRRRRRHPPRTDATNEMSNRESPGSKRGYVERHVDLQ